MTSKGRQRRILSASLVALPDLISQPVPYGASRRGRRSALASRHRARFLATEVGADRRAELLLGGRGGAGTGLPSSFVLGREC